MSNIQVTHGASLNDARSESVILINPKNPQQIVGASRKCKDINAYDFTVAAVYSMNGGITWHDSEPLKTPGWSGLSDPALAWDDRGNVFLVGAAIKNPPKIDYIGIAVYKSTDGGQTWSPPNLIHASSEDEKPWAAGDSGSISFHGRIYIVWDDGKDLRFARTLDHGNTWIGLGTDPAGSILARDSFSPEINVAANGDIYIVRSSGNEIKMIISTNGGDSFHSIASPATGITTLETSLHPWKPNGWPVLPGGTFRVFTLPTACVFGQTVAVAWADYREGVSRIYYALSTDGGASWSTGLSGKPLLTENSLLANCHHFHPQIIVNPDGIIGCAFYEFGPKPKTPLIDVIMAQSFNGGASFKHFTVTDHPWDPMVDAPVSLVNPIASFIGEYFGLDASSKGFYPLWTDTRTGIQELWTDIVPPALNIPSNIYGDMAQILFGIIQDGSGTEIVGGHINHIPPSGPPELDILLGVAAHRIASRVTSPEGIGLQKAAMNMVVKAAQQEILRLESKNRE